jgi:hypothetical protein
MFTRRAVVAGLLASLAMGMFQMLYEAVAGAGLWSPPTLIAATIIRDLQAAAIPVAFQPLAVVLGLIGHMMNSMILGLLFALLIAPRIGSRGWLVIGGAVYGLGIFVIMRFAVVPFLDPVLLSLNIPAFAMAHLMWGAIVGLVLGWQTRRATVLQQAHA